METVSIDEKQGFFNSEDREIVGEENEVPKKRKPMRCANDAPSWLLVNLWSIIKRKMVFSEQFVVWQASFSLN